MGYDDDTERSRGSRSRGKQPVKRPGDRDPVRHRGGRPEYTERGSYSDSGYYSDSSRRGSRRHDRRQSEPELTLITDSFGTGQERDRGRRREDYEEPRRSRARKSEKGTGTAGKGSGYGKASSKNGYQAPAWKKARKKKRKILIIIFEVIILLSVIAFAAYSYVDSKFSGIHKLEWNPEENKNVYISEDKQEQMKGYWTIAVFGVDSRNSSVGKGNNSDVNIICNINQDTGEIKLVSVYRDTYLNINDKNTYNKINAAYLNGGPDQAVKALNKNLDLDIDDYVTFNWKAVADIINILDGVDVEISKAEFSYMNAFITETVKATGIPSVPLKKAGLNHLDGVQAVAYGRLRLMDTDYARTERQRKIIQLAFDKAKTADWATLNNIIQTVYSQVSTSVELTDVIRMGRGIGKLHLGETSGFPQARADANMGSKGACVIPQTLESNVTELHSFLFGDEGYEPSDIVKTISKKISSDSGLAKAKKPVESVGTGGGAVPKSTKEESESRGEKKSTAESSEGVSKSTHETDENGETKRETREWETDANGNLIIYPTRDPKESTGVSRPSPSNGASFETEESSGGADSSTAETIGPTRPENTIPRPGGGTTEGDGGNSGSSTVTPGGSTDTGIIIGPVNNNSSGGQSNMPGGNPSGNSNSNSSSGSGQNVPGGNSGGNSSSGSGQNVPGGNPNGNSNSGSGSGNVEFSGPPGQ